VLEGHQLPWRLQVAVLGCVGVELPTFVLFSTGRSSPLSTGQPGGRRRLRRAQRRGNRRDSRGSDRCGAASPAVRARMRPARDERRGLRRVRPAGDAGSRCGINPVGAARGAGARRPAQPPAGAASRRRGGPNAAGAAAAPPLPPFLAPGSRGYRARWPDRRAQVASVLLLPSPAPHCSHRISTRALLRWILVRWGCLLEGELCTWEREERLGGGINRAAGSRDRIGALI